MPRLIVVQLKTSTPHEGIQQGGDGSQGGIRTSVGKPQKVSVELASGSEYIDSGIGASRRSSVGATIPWLKHDTHEEPQCRRAVDWINHVKFYIC